MDPSPDTTQVQKCCLQKAALWPRSGDDCALWDQTPCTFLYSVHQNVQNSVLPGHDIAIGRSYRNLNVPCSVHCCRSISQRGGVTQNIAFGVLCTGRAVQNSGFAVKICLWSACGLWMSHFCPILSAGASLQINCEYLWADFQMRLGSFRSSQLSWLNNRSR